MMEPVAEDRIIKGINVRILKEQCERLAEPIRASTRSFQFASALDNCVVVINALEARELVLTKTIEQLQGPLSVASLVARAEAAEALLKEAGKALNRLEAVALKQPIAGGPDNVHLHNDWRGWWNKLFRPAMQEARAIHHKIGVKDE